MKFTINDIHDGNVIIDRSGKEYIVWGGALYSKQGGHSALADYNKDLTHLHSPKEDIAYVYEDHKKEILRWTCPYIPREDNYKNLLVNIEKYLAIEKSQTYTHKEGYETIKHMITQFEEAHKIK